MDALATTDHPIVADAEPVSSSEVERVFDLLIADLIQPVDRPEIWSAFPKFLEALPQLPALARAALRFSEGRREVRAAIEIVHSMCQAHTGLLDQATARLNALAIRENQSPVVQGALFYVHGLGDPGNPKYNLLERFCTKPFEELHVLENSAHQCCASWLPQSAGDLTFEDWRNVWNSEAAQAVRASIHDGSYRHCNKIACPFIQEARLPSSEEVAGRSETWRRVIEDKETELEFGPADVNLAYDRTCNLSCPSCRTETYAADTSTRSRYDDLQERNILPMLKEAKTVFITGSGDPFASKNFRRLMERLTPEAYPELRFRMMTNGMLLTPREWERFPALHGRTLMLQISVDGATKKTHELLRRGARWEVMETNLRFASDLKARDLVDELHLSFTVQDENFQEMGEACDLAESLDATGIYFGRLTNWGTFTAADYASKAVFVAGHPRHREFLAAMTDPRLRASRVMLGNLAEFLPSAP